MIIDEIGKAAALEQLAEECTELAQAALKYARKLRGENPTPKTFQEIEKNLVEEFSDVSLCADVLQLDPNLTIMRKKLKRWEERIQNDKA